MHTLQQLSFRNLTQQDFPFVQQIFASWDETKNNDATFIIGIMSRRSLYRIICFNDQPIGIFRIYKPAKNLSKDKTINIKNFVLLPEYRHTPLKIGTNVLGILQGCARSIGFSLNLEVRRNNLKAKGLYEKVLFTKTTENVDNDEMYWAASTPHHDHEPICPNLFFLSLFGNTSQTTNR